MQQATNKPRVFVSSTIYDFKDLRSALKFWLEELGLEVLMSEFNDFFRQPEQDSVSVQPTLEWGRAGRAERCRGGQLDWR